MVQRNSLREKYLNDGYIVIKSVFNKNYISSLRSKMIKLSNVIEKENLEILLDQNVREILLNEKIINTIREILNTNKLLYYSDSSVVNHPDPFKSQNGFHNDARNEDQSVSYNQEYPIVRVGVYFENFKNFSGGLKIKKKSHNYFCFTFRTPVESIKDFIKIFLPRSRYSIKSLKLGKSINLEIEEGDIVIWNLRTHHCGTSRRLKLFPKICLQPNIEKILPKFLFLPTQYKKDRCSMFATFAKKDLTDKNILGYLKLKTNITRLNSIKSDKKLLEYIDKIGFELPDIHELSK